MRRPGSFLRRFRRQFLRDPGWKFREKQESFLVKELVFSYPPASCLSVWSPEMTNTYYTQLGFSPFLFLSFKTYLSYFICMDVLLVYMYMNHLSVRFLGIEPWSSARASDALNH